MHAIPTGTIGSPSEAGPGSAIHGWRQRAWLLAAIGVQALLLLVGGYAWRHATGPLPHYATVTAGRGSVAPAVVSSGTVNPVTTIQVGTFGTYVSGVIQSVLCDFNTRLRAGQLCARIDPRPLGGAPSP
ncbi:hypothetical protein [Janthinobacterium sp. JC611]|uniref:hypothetical protein n=1 Tax=Janthinobacterium sp. JC611 TaxID=2816201 RepID=UPI001BFD109E|nr:hypothetical protein [Janthinobacterium sp. JC611]